MRKLTPVRVSYRDDFLISDRVYMMTGSFISRYLKVHIMLIKYTCDSKSQTLRMRYSFQFYRQTDFTPKRVVVSRLHDTVARFRTGVDCRPGTTSGVNLRRGESRRHDILWWYHVNKCRAMKGNRSELAPVRKSSRGHVNTPLLFFTCWCY